MTALEVRGLRASYAGAGVLDHVDLTVDDARVTAVLGPSGCGKTTLLRVIAGFHRPDAGEVRLAGRTVAADAVDIPPERRRIGLVPQDGALFEHLTVAGNIGFGLGPGFGRGYGRRARERAARVAEMLELVGLADLAGRRPRELSGGQQQRVALARALAPAPALILLDEPFSALDAARRADIRDDVRRVLRDAGTGAIIVTHDRAEALELADRLVVLDAGVVVGDGTPHTLYREPTTARVAVAVGEATLLRGARRAQTAHTQIGPVALSGRGRDGEGRAVIRPEDVALGGLGIATRVLDVVFHGPGHSVWLALPDGETLRAWVTGIPPAAGDTVPVRLTRPVPWLEHPPPDPDAP